MSFDIDYFAKSISKVSVSANFGAAGSVTATSQVTSGDVLAGSSTVINLIGSCTTLCTSMSGPMSINLVGPNAEGAFGSYHLSDIVGGQVAGTYVAAGR